MTIKDNTFKNVSELDKSIDATFSSERFTCKVPLPFTSGVLINGVTWISDPGSAPSKTLATEDIPVTVNDVKVGSTLVTRLYVSVKNPTLLYPIIVSVVIPENCLLENYGSYSIIVQLSGETFERRTVNIGKQNGKLVEITKGLREDEMVVSVGAFQVKMASMSGQAPAHGHAH